MDRHASSGRIRSDLTRTGVLAGTPTFLLLAADMPRAGAAQPADLTTYC